MPGGKTGTGVQGALLLVSLSPMESGGWEEGGMISRPGCPGRWKRRVMEP